MMDAAGGIGIPVQVDHTVEEQVRTLFDRVRHEQNRLDVLVNDIWGGDALTEWGTPFWELDIERGLLMLQHAVNTHIITSRYGAPLMVERNAGLIVEITDGDMLGYRGNLFYDLAKISAIRLAYAMAVDLRERHVTALAVTPGFLRSEAMLDHFGVTEANWKDAILKDRHFAESETPCYVGRAIAALAADPNVGMKSWKVWASWTLAKEYGFRDIDGRQPEFGGYFERAVAAILDRGGPVNEDERALVQARYYHLHLDLTRAEETRRMSAILWPTTASQRNHN
jgi:NAD(P)-dependent dehydrogenase (short-subunit alcohol dehydrogenase family)